MQPLPDAIEELPAAPSQPAARLPTLTEVVELGPNAAEPASAGVTPPSQPADAADWVDQVLAELQPRLDVLLEARLREALAPALARAADGLIRDARLELSHALRDMVQEAVARALKRGGHA